MHVLKFELFAQQVSACGIGQLPGSLLHLQLGAAEEGFNYGNCNLEAILDHHTRLHGVAVARGQAASLASKRQGQKPPQQAARAQGGLGSWLTSFCTVACGFQSTFWQTGPHPRLHLNME